jgi:hypothetical protein
MPPTTFTAVVLREGGGPSTPRPIGSIAGVSGIPDRPPSRTMTVLQAAKTYAAGTGSAVTDLIFSIAKREVTFFSGTALISFL